LSVKRPPFFAAQLVLEREHAVRQVNQRGLPIQLLVRHFTQVGAMWQLNADTRALVQFRPFNLLQDFIPLGKFDVIFCRNVLIYFDQATKTDVFGRLVRVNEPDGHLFLGAAETVVGLTDKYRVCPNRRGVYLPSATTPVQAGSAPARSIEVRQSVAVGTG